MMDLDGEGDVDLADYSLFLALYQGPLNDCNGNGVLDLTDILLGTSGDVNATGIPDECECLADTNGDSMVNVTDLLSLLGGWGPNAGHPADFNGDGNVNVTDLLALLAAWGGCP